MANCHHVIKPGFVANHFFEVIASNPDRLPLPTDKSKEWDTQSVLDSHFAREKIR
jgi:hypothetical protein